MSTPGNPVFRQNSLFESLSPEALEEVNRIPEAVTYAPDDVIFDEGDTDDYLYLIASGVVRISKRGRGGQQETLAYLEANDYFGDMAAFDPASRSARATVVQEALLGRVDRAGVSELIRIAPREIAENLTRRSIQRLRQTDSHLIKQMLEAERLSLVGSMAGGIIHDLKNPLGVVRGVACMLEEHQGDPTLLRWAGLLQRSVNRMLDMVQEILDFSRGYTALNRGPVSVTDLVQDLDEQILRQAAESGIQVKTELSFLGTIWVDRARFTRVLLNILKNSVEAMPGGGMLMLSVEARDGEIVFTVADSGMGIPPDILARLFEPFVTHGKAYGTGLGMAIVKSVIDAHNGRISVDSTPGLGTRIEIFVPAETVDSAGFS